MLAALLADGRLYRVLQHFDEDLAAEQRAGGCLLCGAALHASSYPRKPRGVPRELIVEYGQRLSFCCARSGCRKRATPASLRFLGRKVYLAAVVVLITALRCGPTPARLQTLKELAGVDRRTVMRWRAWWTRTLRRYALLACSRRRADAAGRVRRAPGRAARALCRPPPGSVTC